MRHASADCDITTVNNELNKTSGHPMHTSDRRVTAFCHYGCFDYIDAQDDTLSQDSSDLLLTRSKVVLAIA